MNEILNKKMKAAIYTEFGPPDVLQIKEIARPIPRSDEILIKIHATTVEKEDPDMRKAPGLNGLRKPKKQILGMLLAGEVVEIGSGVKKYQIGDKLYGSAGMGLGTTAEYISLKETRALAPIPDGISYVDAVSVLNGVFTALPYLRDQGKIQQGHHVLINGASGSVGSAAILLAKYYKATITAVCSTDKGEWVRNLGADHIIDYTQTDFTQSDSKFDIIFDTVGKSSFSKCKSILAPSGRFLTTIPKLNSLIRILFVNWLAKKKTKFIASGLRSVKKKLYDLEFLNQLFEEQHIQPTIDQEYSLAEIAKAHIHVAAGHKKGSVVIRID